MTALTVAAQAKARATGQAGPDTNPTGIPVTVETLMTLPEVSDVLRASETKVRQLIADRLLVAVEMPGRGAGIRPTLRVRPADLRAFIDGLPVAEARTA